MRDGTPTRRLAGLALAMLTTGVLVACGDDDSGTNPPPPPVATQVSFATQPSNSVAGASVVAPRSGAQLASVVATSVEILDASGDRMTSATNSVTLALGANPGGGTLSGTTTVAAQNGVASFTDLTIDKAASGYTLVASASGLTGATSNAFDIAAAAPVSIEFVTQPATTGARAIMSAVEVRLLDEFGNLASGDVTLSLETNPGTMIFHSSGLANPIFQRVDPLTPAVAPPLPNAQPANSAEILDMVYDPATGLVLATQFDPFGNSLSTVDPLDGSVAYVGLIQAPVAGTFPPYVNPLAWEPGGTRLLAGDLNNATLYEIDPASGAKTTADPVTGTVGGFNGMAADPTSGTMYAVVQQAQIVPPDPARRIRDLVTLDPVTLVATTIGTLTEGGVGSLAFLPDGTLLAVTGDGGNNAETLWTVNTADASMTQLLVLGDGDDGEAIATVPAALWGTLTVAAEAGIASFDDLWVDAPAAGYSLKAMTDGLTDVVSATFDVTVPTP